MAIQFAESWNNYVQSPLQQAFKWKWTPENIFTALRFFTGRWGTGQACELNSGNDSSFIPLASPTSELCLAFGFRRLGTWPRTAMSISSTISSAMITLGQGTDLWQGVHIFIQSDGTFGYGVGDAYSGYTGSDPNNADRTGVNIYTWHWLEIRSLLDGVNGEVEVYLDGEQVINATGIDTQVSSFTDFEFINFHDSFNAIEYDSLIVYDTSGATVNTFPLGDTEIETLRPIADGFQTDFTPLVGPSNFQDVDDTPGPSTTTEVSASAVASIDSYAVSPLSKLYATVLWVQPHLNGFADNPSQPMKTIRTRIRSNAADRLGTTIALNPIDTDDEGLYYKEDYVEQDPDAGGIPWTAAAVNAAEYGFEVLT